MKIISFAWTVPSLLAGRKTRTRREWTDEYAERFKVGDLIQAYDRQPRFGGKCIAIIEITGIKQESTSEMTSDDYEKEGFKYFEEKGLKIWDKDPAIAFEDWMEDDCEVWIIDFKVKEIK
jgi:hypothetical protein